MARWTLHSKTPVKHRKGTKQNACCTCGEPLENSEREVGICNVQWQTVLGHIVTRCDHLCHVECSVGNYPKAPGEAQRRLHCGCHGQAVHLQGGDSRYWETTLLTLQEWQKSDMPATYDRHRIFTSAYSRLTEIAFWQKGAAQQVQAHAGLSPFRVVHSAEDTIFSTF